MVEQGFNARGFVASHGTGYTDQSGELGFANWRSAAWWMTREMLDPDSGISVMLPDDDELIGDLTAPKVKRITSTSCILVEAKEEIRKRIGRSTDCGDAVIQILTGPVLCREQEEHTELVYEPARVRAQW